MPGELRNKEVQALHLSDELINAINGLRTYLSDGKLTASGLTISAGDATKFKTVSTCSYSIGGTVYAKAATDLLAFSAGDTINTAAGAGQFWGVWLVEIGADGTVHTKSPAADQLYATEAAAIAALPAVTASHIQVGYITVQSKAGASWTAQTDDMTAASDCAARNFYDLPAAKALPAALSNAGLY